MRTNTIKIVFSGLLFAVAGYVGLVSAESAVYKSIPYAQAPVGEKRWAVVEDVVWDGVSYGNEFSASCPQPRYGLGVSEEQSEDCLFLNVWSPDTAGKLPVMVWIRGGGFRAGSGNIPGELIAREGVVVVSNLWGPLLSTPIDFIAAIAAASVICTCCFKTGSVRAATIASTQQVSRESLKVASHKKSKKACGVNSRRS